MDPSEIPNIIGRLLHEISWEGNARTYREGGKGRENVLTAETFQALDFLPRTHFLGEIVGSMQGADEARAIMLSEIETVKIDLLAGDIYLRHDREFQKKIIVQPDGLLRSDSVLALLEAKRIKRSSFQSEQLARELVAAKKEAKNKVFLLMLITGNEPPYSVDKHGKLGVEEAIDLYIDQIVGEEVKGVEMSADEFRESVNSSVCWITWAQLGQVVKQQMDCFLNESVSTIRSVERLSESIVTSIEWHS